MHSVRCEDEGYFGIKQQPKLLSSRFKPGKLLETTVVTFID